MNVAPVLGTIYFYNNEAYIVSNLLFDLVSKKVRHHNILHQCFSASSAPHAGSVSFYFLYIIVYKEFLFTLIKLGKKYENIWYYLFILIFVDFSQRCTMASEAFAAVLKNNKFPTCY